jgi:hypothetical protein
MTDLTENQPETFEFTENMIVEFNDLYDCFYNTNNKYRILEALMSSNFRKILSKLSYANHEFIIKDTFICGIIEDQHNKGFIFTEMDFKWFLDCINYMVKLSLIQKENPTDQEISYALTLFDIKPGCPITREHFTYVVENYNPTPVCDVSEDDKKYAEKYKHLSDKYISSTPLLVIDDKYVCEETNNTIIQKLFSENSITYDELVKNIDIIRKFFLHRKKYYYAYNSN